MLQSSKTSLMCHSVKWHGITLLLLFVKVKINYLLSEVQSFLQSLIQTFHNFHNHRKERWCNLGNMQATSLNLISKLQKSLEFPEISSTAGHWFVVSFLIHTHWEEQECYCLSLLGEVLENISLDSLRRKAVWGMKALTDTVLCWHKGRSGKIN